MRTRSLFERSQDLLRLKATWRNRIALFTAGGFIAGAMLAASWAYPLQLALGLTPGAPAGSEPGGLSFLAAMIFGVLILGFLGMALGALAFSALLTGLTPMTFRQSLRAIFLSYYPRDWFGA
ncbi:MAG: hypothetical protein H7X75_06255 [Burkholderiaceae bacterium]|nr:hypothetical protein [Burkholderiaceae bacterium]